MAKCAACGKFLSPAGAATCTACPCKYHKACIGINNDGNSIPFDWVCPECSIKKKRTSDNSSTPVRGVCASQSERAPSPAEEMEVSAMRREFAEYMVEFREFRMEVRSSLAGMIDRVNGLERRLDALENRDTEVTTDNNRVTQLQQTVVALKQELNDRDQDMLLSDLEIGHIPEEKGENVLQTITVMAAKLGVKLECRDIVFAERVGVFGAVRAGGAGAAGAGGGAGPRPRRVVVRLARRALRDELLQAARVRRTLTSADAGQAGPPTRIYINERLTRVNHLLFHRVREECRKQQWRYTWTKRGRIYARQGEGKQVYAIRNDADLNRVFNIEAV